MGTRSSPTLNLILLSAVVFLLQNVGGLLGADPWGLALVWPLGVRPWALVTSVFAHATFSHLLTNMLALAVLGLLLERRTTDARFYAFFLLAGALSGIVQVGVSALVFGDRTAVLGASGAVFALLGYLLGGNRLADRAFAGVSVSARTQLVGFLLIAAVLTVATQSQRVALFAHFSGLVLGLVAGRTHLLRTGRGDVTKSEPEPW